MTAHIMQPLEDSGSGTGRRGDPLIDRLQAHLGLARGNRAGPEEDREARRHFIWAARLLRKTRARWFG